MDDQDPEKSVGGFPINVIFRFGANAEKYGGDSVKATVRDKDTIEYKDERMEKLGSNCSLFSNI